MRIAILALAVAFAATGCVTEKTGVLSPEPELTAAAGLNVTLGFEYLRAGRRADAVAKFEKAIEQDPDNAQAFFGLALVNDQVGDHKQAKRHFQSAAKAAPDDANIANAFGIFLCKREERAAAEAQFMAAARNLNYQTPAVAYTNAGICAHGGKDLVKAEAHLREALKSDPNNQQALLELAAVSYDKGDALRGRAFLQRLRELGPSSPRTLLLSHRVEKALGDERAAARFADELKRQFPNSSEAIELATGVAPKPKN